MKLCAYCGRQNEDVATRCVECGTDEFKIAATLETKSIAPRAPEKELPLRDVLTDPARLFRILVIVGTLAYLILFFQLYLFGQMISDRTHDALAWRGYGALLPWPASVSWLSMLLWVALAVGLWNFSKSARLVFTLFIAFFTATTMLWGVDVQTAFGCFLGTIVTMADGAILTMAYTSPLKERFG